ncbi:baseplate J/gp47 family protein [uncultured Pseudacidovorax sp.]|uniref:baseplate J/gp47 family protein n=1 Tax=uncultured Pseudacidovorax sp. TaxID=679313 RepID=UPI0025D4A18F|nr:baseplate J/gp47 family protein [uncultured Pseudacidovorax sp.]
MPYARPQLRDLQTQVANDIANALPGSDPLLRFSNLSVMGAVQAYLANAHFGYLDWIAKQAVPYTAEGEFMEAWAALKGVTRKAASSAAGAVTFPAIAGSVIPAGTLVVRGDGREFATTAEVTTPSGGTVVVQAQAVADATGQTGAWGNTDLGVAMTLGTAIVGVQSGGAVTTAFTGGADVEDDASLRTRMLAAWRRVPQGGAKWDYVTWALAVPGVTRAWCLPNALGSGTVSVYTMFDEAEAEHGGFPQGTDGVASDEPRDTPATGDQLTVANALSPLRPVTALVYSVAPLPQTVNFTITGLSGASAAVKARVAAAIAGVFFLAGTPEGGTVAMSLIESAVAAIAGTQGYVITVPAGNISVALGHLPVLGTITWAA